MTQKTLLTIVELGGYPDFTSDYERQGFSVTPVDSVRKALSVIKQKIPDVIVTEFNFQSDFRDRTSSIETLMASLQPLNPRPLLVVFFEPQYQTQFNQVRERFTIDHALSFPINREELVRCLARIGALNRRPA